MVGAIWRILQQCVEESAVLALDKHAFNYKNIKFKKTILQETWSGTLINNN
jgi:hypothetical protein